MSYQQNGKRNKIVELLTHDDMIIYFVFIDLFFYLKEICFVLIFKKKTKNKVFGYIWKKKLIRHYINVIQSRRADINCDN